jgi:hypothetical protein
MYPSSTDFIGLMQLCYLQETFRNADGMLDYETGSQGDNSWRERKAHTLSKLTHNRKEIYTLSKLKK